MKNDIIDLYEKLSRVPTVSGSESFNAEKIAEIVNEYTDFFDSFKITPSGSVNFYRRSKVKDAPKVIFDAHIDTVGFMVKEILDGGFVRVCGVGGIDARILPAKVIEIYGKKTIPAVFISVPPHLGRNEKKEGIFPELCDLLLDTGLAKEELEKVVSLGDFCGYSDGNLNLLNGNLCGKSMDDKICASVVICAAEMIGKNKKYNNNLDICVSLSSSEEVSGTGIKTTGFTENADAAIVLDVNFGRTPDIPERESYVPGDGCGVSYSSTTSRTLTELLIKYAQECGIKLQTMVETNHTGTNAHALEIAGSGTPCAVLSVPLRYMHTYSEVVNVDDAFGACSVLSEFAVRFYDDYKRISKGKIIKKAEGKK